MLRLYANDFRNLQGMDQFLAKHNLSKLTQEKNNKKKNKKTHRRKNRQLNGSIAIKEIESIKLITIQNREHLA
jgi:hypothetical protein